MSDECQYCEFYSRELEKLQKEIESLTKANEKYREALEKISQDSYEANPWTVVKTKSAKIAEDCLMEIKEQR